jgi:putative ABC transport system permease protein
MLKNYFLTAARNLRKHVGATLISTGGLAVGLAACLLIGMYVVHETSYDEHFQRADDIYRVAWFGDNPQTRTPHPMAQAMVDDLPEVERAVSISPIWGPGLTRPEITFQYQDRIYREGRVLSADSTFFDVFAFDFIHGSPQTALTQAGGVVLTESTARKYFGEDDPMGKPLRVNGEYDLFVSGVVADVPERTHFHFDILISYVTLKPAEQGEFFEWADFGHYNYVMLDPEANPAQLERKINSWSEDYIDFSPQTSRRMEAGTIGFRLQPLTDIHLHSDIRWELEPNGRIAYVYIFATAALFILLIACVNFINLSTAGSESRAREIGVRKVLGARRLQLAGQFVAQGLIVTTLALIAAVALVELVQPAVNAFLGVKLGLPWSSGSVLLLLAAIIFVVGLLAGGYPAFVLSSFRPIAALKGSTGSAASTGMFRKSLIVFQFAAAIGLVASMLVVRSQLDYMDNLSLGMETSRIVAIPVESGAVAERYEALRERWLSDPSVESVAAVSNLPGGNFNQNPVEWRPDVDRIDAVPWQVDYDALETLRIPLVDGRTFSRDRPADLTDAFILNETAVTRLGMDAPVGERITYMDDGGPREGTVIGVVEDFHFKSLHREIEPMIIELKPQAMSYVLAKLDTSSPDRAVNLLAAGWSDVIPDVPFESRFLDASIDAQYRGDRQTGVLFGMFGGVALLLACLGLFGLVALAARRRTKEIGIRKTLGAGVGGIVLLLSRDFIVLVGIAFLIGAPPAAIVMNGWLSDFAYSSGLGLSVFFMAGFIVALVAAATVAWQSWRAATADPVKSLRYE